MTKTSKALLVSLSVLMSATLSVAYAQDDKPVSPMELLQDMSDDLGLSPSFSFSAAVLSDEKFNDELIKRVLQYNIAIRRPSTLVMRIASDDGEVTYVDFNGERVRVYYTGDKEYAEIPFMGDIDGFADLAEERGLSRTAMLDLLRTNLYVDAEASITNALLLDDYTDPVVPDAAIYNCVFHGAGVKWQVWLRDGDKVLPDRLVVTYTGQLGDPEHATQFNNWKFGLGDENLPTLLGVPGDVSDWKKVDFVPPNESQ